MVSLNRVLLIGNLTKDPELRYTPSGTPVANLRLAVNSIYKDQSGQRKEETCFVTVVVWSRQAEICHQYLKKGRPVFIEGRLVYRTWEAEGKPRSTMEVRADRVQFLGQAPRRADAEAPGDDSPRAEVPQPEPEPSSAPAEEEADADVPF
jgi:single-strand DNA-binding protein